jgi:hypothetical protein
MMTQMKRIASRLDLPIAGMFCGPSQLPDNLINNGLAPIPAG